MINNSLYIFAMAFYFLYNLEDARDKNLKPRKNYNLNKER